MKAGRPRGCVVGTAGASGALPWICGIVDSPWWRVLGGKDGDLAVYAVCHAIYQVCGSMWKLPGMWKDMGVTRYVEGYGSYQVCGRIWELPGMWKEIPFKSRVTDSVFSGALSTKKFEYTDNLCYDCP